MMKIPQTTNATYSHDYHLSSVATLPRKMKSSVAYIISLLHLNINMDQMQ